MMELISFKLKKNIAIFSLIVFSISSSGTALASNRASLDTALQSTENLRSNTDLSQGNERLDTSEQSILDRESLVDESKLLDSLTEIEKSIDLQGLENLSDTSSKPSPEENNPASPVGDPDQPNPDNNPADNEEDDLPEPPNGFVGNDSGGGEFKQQLEPFIGNLNVEPDSKTGALVMSYPIVVPPGRKGMTPDLTLTYNSQDTKDDNIFGYGWSMNIPYISRLNKNGTNEMFDEQYFASSLHGELVLTDSGPGQNGTYMAKHETGDFVKYEHEEPSYWIATTKDGTEYLFGASEQSGIFELSSNTAVLQNNLGQASKWLIREIKDTNGNKISYTYKQATSSGDAVNQIYPSKIEYAYKGSAPTYKIIFHLENRPDLTETANQGFRVRTDKRVSMIEIESLHQWVKKYHFVYTNGDNGHRSNLYSIREQGRDEAGNSSYLLKDKFFYTNNDSVPEDWSFDSNYNIPVDFEESVNNNDDFGVRIFDVNGDGYDDIVHSSHNKYESFKKTYINKADGTGWSASSQYNPPIFFMEDGEDNGARFGDVNGDGLVDIIVAKQNDTSSKRVYINTGSGWQWDNYYKIPLYFVDETGNSTGMQLAELNGDGLVDIVFKLGSPFKAYMNKGDGTGWEKDSNFYIPNSYNTPGMRLVDLNADGLTDFLQYHDDNNHSTTYLNDGSKWAYTPDFNLPIPFVDGNNLDRDEGVRLVDVNGDKLVDILHLDNDHEDVYINKGDGWFKDNSFILPKLDVDAYEYTKIKIADVNGDGMADFLKSPQNTSSSDTFSSGVFINNNKKSDLVKQVSNRQGGTLEITYQPTTAYKDNTNELLNPDLPMVLQTVSSIKQSPLPSSSYNTAILETYTYTGGEYYFGNTNNREFAGFAMIEKDNNADTKTKTYYHQGNTNNSSKGEHQDHSSKIGQSYLTEITDHQGNLYSRSFKKWINSSLGGARHFIYIDREIEATYDGDSDHKAKSTRYHYDINNGNLEKLEIEGEVQISSSGNILSTDTEDAYNTEYKYTNGNIQLPYQETTKNSNGEKLRESKYYYDNKSLGSADKGNLTKEDNWLEGSKYITTNYEYHNDYGLLKKVIDPEGKTTAYDYDSKQLYPEEVIKDFTFGDQITTYTYDYSSGQVLETKGPNGNKVKNEYDEFDRITKQYQTDQENSNNLVLIADYTYTDTSFPYEKKTTYVSPGVGYQSYNYYDGLGRLIQTRDQSESSSYYNVKDYQYNNLGLLYKESIPYSNYGSSKTNPTSTSNKLTTYSYDPLGRTKLIANSLGVTSNIYDDWKETTIDFEGNLKDYYYNLNNDLIKVVEHNNGSLYTTKYTYDFPQQLKTITDAQGNIKEFTYDNLGRKTHVKDFHKSSDSTYVTKEYEYDDAGNQIAYFDTEGNKTKFTYDELHRLKTEDYLPDSGVEINYTYDNCTKGIGKLCKVESSDFILEYDYNHLGLLETESIDIDKFEDGKQITNYKYNLLGGIKEIHNNNFDSKITYSYHHTGQVDTISHNSQTIVEAINYAPMGLIEKIDYGNGTESNNIFDSTKQYRLKEKNTKKGSQYLQRLIYTQDDVGNITKIEDKTKNITSNFTYDDLYRLKSATATSSTSGQSYNRTYNYDKIGNITYKSDQGSYSYNGHSGNSYANPHAVTYITGGINIDYDKRGNLISSDENEFTWDYKDQMLSSTNSDTSTNYYYDHNGQRIHTHNSDDTNKRFYFNKNFEIRDEAKITNIMLGRDKISSIRVEPEKALPPIVAILGVPEEVILGVYPSPIISFYITETSHPIAAEMSKTFLHYKGKKESISNYYIPESKMIVINPLTNLNSEHITDEAYLSINVCDIENNCTYIESTKFAISAPSPAGTISAPEEIILGAPATFDLSFTGDSYATNELNNVFLHYNGKQELINFNHSENQFTIELHIDPKYLTEEAYLTTTVCNTYESCTSIESPKFAISAPFPSGTISAPEEIILGAPATFNLSFTENPYSTDELTKVSLYYNDQQEFLDFNQNQNQFTIELDLDPKYLNEEAHLIATVCNVKVKCTPIKSSTFTISSPDTIVLEDAEDGDINGWWLPWHVKNSYDNDKQSNVIEFTGDMVPKQLLIDQSPLDHQFFSLDFKSSQAGNLQFGFKFELEEENTWKHLIYHNDDSLEDTETTKYIKLPSYYYYEQWHNITRNFQEDFSNKFPKEKITKLSNFLIYSQGAIDNLIISKDGEVTDLESFAPASTEINVPASWEISEEGNIEWNVIPGSLPIESITDFKLNYNIGSTLSISEGEFNLSGQFTYELPEDISYISKLAYISCEVCDSGGNCSTAKSNNFLIKPDSDKKTPLPSLEKLLNNYEL